MAAEDAGGSELAKLVTHHVLGDVHRDKLVAIVHGDSLTHEVGRNHRSSRPCLDGNLLVGLLCLDYTFFQFVENIRTFL